MPKIIFFFVGIFVQLTAWGQSGNISGSIGDKDAGKPIENAVVSLFNPTDSTLEYFTRTDKKGDYLLQKIQVGPYLLMASHPAYADIYFDITVGENTQMTQIQLLSRAKLLQEVIINTGAAIHIKGDTTVFMADSFAVGPNANVEELLKKLPGLQVDKDGNITAMGNR